MTTTEVPFFDDARPLRDLFSEQNFCIPADWFGVPPRLPFDLFFAIGHTTLSFGIRVFGEPNELVPPPQLGEFREGLWERDVCELFLDGSKEEYFELNLAPSGAWWSMRFKSQRCRHPVPFCPSVECVAHRSHGWSAALRVAQSAFGDGLFQGQTLSGNISAIVDGQFFSFAKSQGEPDFHRPRSTFRIPTAVVLRNGTGEHRTP